MELLGVKLSKKAEEFITAQQAKLNKPVIYKDISELSGGFGALEQYSNCFIIYADTLIKGEPFECNIAHELLHAVQLQKGYPFTVRPQKDAEGQKVFGESLGSLVLDLDVYNRLEANGFDNSLFYNHRYKVVKGLATRNFDMLANEFRRTWFSVNLALVLMVSPAERQKFILSLFKNKENWVAETAVKITEIIKAIGYSAPEQAFIALCEISNLLESWGNCNINFKGKTITSAQQYMKEFKDLREQLLD